MINVLKDKPNAELNYYHKFMLNFISDDDIKGKVILDIGCGYGWFEYQATMRQCSKIYGIDYNLKDIDSCKAYFDGVKNVEFYHGTALKLPFPDNYFDTVVSFEVLEHIPCRTERKMFKEIKRVLKPNGILYLTTPYNNILCSFLDPAWYFGHRHYSKKYISRIVRDSDMKLKYIKAHGSVWCCIITIDMYISKWIFRRKPFFKKIINEKINKTYDKEGICNLVVKVQK